MAERRIEGLGTVKAEPMHAGDALELYADVMRIGGKALNRLPALIMAVTSETPGESEFADIIALHAIADMLATTPSKDVREIVQRIVETAMVQLQDQPSYRPMLMGDFTGRLNHLLPVVKFVLEVQFKDFLPVSPRGGIVQLLRDALAKKN